MKNYGKRLEKRSWQKLNRLQRLYLKFLVTELVIGIVLVLKLKGVLKSFTPFINELDYKKAVAESLSIIPSNMKCEPVFNLAQKGNLKIISADSLVFICSKPMDSNLQVSWVRTDIKKFCIRKEDNVCTSYDIKVIRYKILRGK